MDSYALYIHMCSHISYFPNKIEWINTKHTHDVTGVIKMKEAENKE